MPEKRGKVEGQLRIYGKACAKAKETIHLTLPKNHRGKKERAGGNAVNKTA